jgi:hypothetical protein
MVTTVRRLKIALVAAAALAPACSRPETPPQSPAATTPARPGPRGRPASPAADLDIEAMLSPVPEYEGMGRNLFAFGEARPSMEDLSQEEEAPPEVAEEAPTEIVALPPRAPGRPAAARLDMKYAGFLEKTGPDGDKAKYAIFIDGNEILAGMEGELVANRFTVIEIGLESVTVSPSGSSATQRIPLQSN